MEEFSPRPYQIDLFEKAVEGNTIIYLPTGSGKTYIAVMLIKNMSNDVRSPISEGGKRTIFAVNTVPLVDQQCAYIARHTDLTCQGYSGDMNVDFWTKNEWMKEIESNQVLVMTSQIFVNILSHGFIQLNQVNLIIFDECHHAVKDHPMRQVMKLFEIFRESDHPKILGLSATLLNSNIKPEKVNESILELEITFNSKVITVDTLESVIGYGRVQEKRVIFENPQSNNLLLPNVFDDIFNHMLKILDAKSLQSIACNPASSFVFQPKTKSRRLSSIVENIKEHLTTMGLYGGSKVVLLHMIQLICMKKVANDRDTSIILDFLITQMTVLRKLMDQEMNKKIFSTEYAHIINNSSDKLLKLLSLLKKYWNDRDINKKFCCIIFVKRRFTTKVLYHILKNVKESNDEFKFLEPDYIVGFSNDPYKNSPESLCVAKWNRETLIRFRQGLSNCLIATDVADEGIDIPICSFIVRYDAPNDFRSYVQSKGRARDSSCFFAIFMANNDTKLCDTYTKWMETEKSLRRYLVDDTKARAEPIPEDIINNLYATEIPAYRSVAPNGNVSTLTDVSVIALVNRYCDFLSTSKFVCCVPTFVLHKVKYDCMSEHAYWVSLKFPLISPLRDTINGDIMSNLILAKRSAAMKACIALHKIGELNDKLLPRGADEIVEDITVHLRNWRNDPEDSGITGTNSYTRPHELVQVESLNAAQPLSDSSVYLHIIHAKPSYSIPSNNRQKVFYNHLNNKAGYAILSNKKLPILPTFPIHMNVGQLNVNIAVNHSKLILVSSEIEKLKKFHWLIFNDVLEVVKNFLIFDKNNMDNSYLIVPIDKNWQINWELIEKYNKIQTISATEYAKMDYNDINNVSESMEICPSSSPASIPIFRNINEENWQIVTPKYRSSQEVYIVTKVCHEMNPMSPFPTDMPNYFEYYKEKHKVEAVDMKQPLFEVKPVTRHINFILPKGEPGVAKKRKSENHEEHFIPELCNVILFSAMYWLKAIALPSIIHRVNQLLIADELRCQIINEIGLGKLNVEKWPSLEFTEQEKIQTHLQQQEKKILIDDDSDTESIIDMDIDSFDFSVDNVDMSTKEIPAKNNIIIDNNIDIDILSLESNNFPWSKESEPVDLDKNMEKIQVIDIEYFYQFNSKISFSHEEIIKAKVLHCGYSKRPLNPLPPPQLHVLNIVSAGNIGPSPIDIMKALTTTLAGDAFNLERLETLGDSYLKFITSSHLYECYDVGEGQLTMYKDRIIGNRNLYYCGESKKLPGKLKIERFISNGNFIPPSFCVPREIQKELNDEKIATSVLHELRISKDEQISGELNYESLNIQINQVQTWPEKRNDRGKSGTDNFIGIHFVKDKCVSDSVEALTGVYLRSMGLIGAAKLLKWFGVLPENINIDKVLFGPSSNPRLNDGNPIDHMPWMNFIQNCLEYKFNDKIYLLQAFTHSSYTGHSITCDYQRLEFLGDAVIDFLITVYIFEHCGNLGPGDLTDLRSALVNNITFACLAVKYGLHTALLQYSPAINDAIEKFVTFQAERNYKIDDDLLWILYEEDECNIAECVEVPKILADIFEALIGAIYLDTGKDLGKVWEILYGLMKNEIDSFSKDVPKQPVRAIFETTSVSPKFMKAEQVGNDMRMMIPLRIQVSGKTKFFHGFGSTRYAAKRAAAKQALKFLRRHNFN